VWSRKRARACMLIGLLSKMRLYDKGTHALTVIITSIAEAEKHAWIEITADQKPVFAHLSVRQPSVASSDTRTGCELVTKVKHSSLQSLHMTEFRGQKWNRYRPVAP
jgi:hypothetical protein